MGLISDVSTISESPAGWPSPRAGSGQHPAHGLCILLQSAGHAWQDTGPNEYVRGKWLTTFVAEKHITCGYPRMAIALVVELSRILHKFTQLSFFGLCFALS
jgi:hypothetical protein